MTDAGYAGAGIYTTAQAEYSEAYAGDDDGEHVMLVCWVAVGQTYPDSRATDYLGGAPYEAHSCFYDEGGNGLALKSKFDSHLFCVTQPTDFSNAECYGAMPGVEPDFDELVVKEERQVLPLAVVRYVRGPQAPADAADAAAAAVAAAAAAAATVPAALLLPPPAAPTHVCGRRCRCRPVRARRTCRRRPGWWRPGPARGRGA